MLPLWFVHRVEETENPSVRVGGGGCGLIVFCSWMIPCFYYDPLCQGGFLCISKSLEGGCLQCGNGVINQHRLLCVRYSVRKQSMIAAQREIRSCHCAQLSIEGLEQANNRVANIPFRGSTMQETSGLLTLWLNKISSKLQSSSDAAHLAGLYKYMSELF